MTKPINTYDKTYNNLLTKPMTKRVKQKHFKKQYTPMAQPIKTNDKTYQNP